MATQDPTTKCEGELSEAIKKKEGSFTTALFAYAYERNSTKTNIVQNWDISKNSYLCTDFFTFVPLLGRTG